MKRLLTALSIVFVLAISGIFAQSATVFPSLVAGETAQNMARLAETDSWEALAEVALWASGASDAVAAKMMSRIREEAAELITSPDLPDSAAGKGEFVLTFMHQKLLKRYAATQTRLDEIFVSGRYNCVSSAVLYMLLASSVGLDVRGVVTKDHAFVTINSQIDVETTNRYGFDPGNRKEFHDGFGKSTGFAYVPAHNYRNRAEINRLELVSLIQSNRIVELEKSKRYSDAVVLAVDREALLSGRSNSDATFFPNPENDVLGRLINYGASLLNAGKEEDVFAWTLLASERSPDDARWEDLNYAALNNLVGKLLRSKKEAAAEEAFRRISPRLTAANTAKISEMLTSNRLVSLHNAFVALYNKRNYEGAKQAALDALAEFPGNRQFASDVSAADKALSQTR
jgi:hypothetical protein